MTIRCTNSTFRVNGTTGIRTAPKLMRYQLSYHGWIFYKNILSLNFVEFNKNDLLIQFRFKDFFQKLSFVFCNYLNDLLTATYFLWELFLNNFARVRYNDWLETNPPR